jgi:hypothetical protein
MNWDWKPDLYRIFIDRTAGDHTWSGFLWHLAERRGMLEQFANSEGKIIPPTRSTLEKMYEASLDDDQYLGDYRNYILTAAEAVEGFLKALTKIEPSMESARREVAEEDAEVTTPVLYHARRNDPAFVIVRKATMEMAKSSVEQDARHKYPDGPYGYTHMAWTRDDSGYYFGTRGKYPRLYTVARESGE